MIEFKNIHHSYGDKISIRNLSFRIQPGEFCVLIGPSGCGKSTTLKLTNRLLIPDKGEILIGDTPVTTLNPVHLRRTMGYVIQETGLFPHYTVAQNVAIVPNLLGWPKDKINLQCRKLMDLTGVPWDEYKDQYPSQLSGGQAQRIGVARALAGDPPILLMDEPFGAVDPITRSVLQDEFSRIQKKLKKTVLFVTHDMDEAVRLGDRIILLKDGEIAQDASTDKLLSSPANDFVRSFIGADRAIKRLARFRTGDHCKKTLHYIEGQNLQEKHQTLLKKQGYLWLTDDSLILKGWISSSGDLKKAESSQFGTVVDNTIGLPEEASLRDALGKMIEQGVRTLPVVNRTRQFIGEISLSDIEKISGDRF